MAEVIGLVMFGLPFILSTRELSQYILRTPRGPGGAEVARLSLRKEYGLLLSLVIVVVPGTADIIRRVSKDILGGEDARVVAFLTSYTSSYNMVGVAGAIIAQVAITGLSLTRLSDSHWTAEAFFIISLITGALSVFFSCYMSPAVYTLHYPDDIRDWLAKPARFENREDLRTLLHQAKDPSSLSDEDKDVLRQYLVDRQWKVPSAHSALLLMAPLNLLSTSLNTFLIGLGVYLGKVYTESLVPSYGKGSLAILILFVGVTLAGIATVYVPLGFRAVEHKATEQIQTLRRLLSEETTHRDGSTDDQGKFPGSKKSGAHWLMKDAKQNGRFQRDGTAANQGLPGPHSALESHWPSSLPETAGGGSGSESTAPPQEKSQGIQAALAELIKSQEDGARAGRRLLEALEASRDVDGA